MKIGDHVSFWPQPIIHLYKPLKEDGRNIIIMKLCGYYNKWYHCADIVIISYKHTFHPFCFATMLEHSNKCCVCKEKLHPN